MADTPERFYRVSQTQLSIARHYSVIRYNGVHYVYDPTKDELIREDVLKVEQKAKLNARRKRGKQ